MTEAYFVDENQQNFIHTKNFVCPNGCGRKYKYKRGLRRHLYYECGKEKQFKCDICLKTFVHNDKRKRHMVMVHGVTFLKLN